MMTYRQAAADLARALERMPCYCQHEWAKGAQHVVKQCGRCVALEDYKAVESREITDDRRAD